MHRVIFAPFILIYVFVLFIALAFLFAMVEIGVIRYAFAAIGLPPEVGFMALMASLIGSYINIPITRVHGGTVHHSEMVAHLGIRYRLPLHAWDGNTMVAINVGGAVVPALIVGYLLAHQPWLTPDAILATLVVSFVVHRFARPVPGLGIATPMFIPPIAAALTAYLVSSWSGHAPSAIAYISGTMGTLIGADLVNLGKISELGAPVASIGGAGTFDGIFLTGIVAALLA